MRSLVLLMTLLACQRLPPGSETPTTGADADVDTDVDSDTDTDTDTDLGPSMRIVHWNIEFMGSTSSAEYGATRDILARLDADVVAINEVDSDERDELEAMADELGYDFVFFPSSNPFGAQRNAFLSRLEVTDSHAWTSAELSGDSGANDVTRYPISIRVVPDGGEPIVIVGTHINSGFGDIEEFRRAVDGIRTVGAADEYGDRRRIVLGDYNAEIDDRYSDTFTREPSGAPSSYDIGDDIVASLSGNGIRNDPFVPLEDAGFEMIDALQLDGRDATRQESGRRLDYAWATSAVHDAGVRAEVYDPRDEGMAGGLDKAGDAPSRDAADLASDHLPVVVDIAIND